MRIAWEVFLDEESLLKFQAEQKEVHAARIREQGAPGYIDEVSDSQLALTMFHDGEEQTKQLKTGKAVRVAPAGVDRKPTAEAVTATVSSVKTMGRQTKVVLTTSAKLPQFQPTGLARLWIVRE